MAAGDPISAFARDPALFSVKLVRALRESPDAPVEPSVRQTIAIPQLLLARRLRRGALNGNDFVEVAVCTSPPENQEAARRIANELLNPRRKARRRRYLDVGDLDVTGREMLEAAGSPLDSLLDEIEVIGGFGDPADLDALFDEADAEGGAGGAADGAADSHDVTDSLDDQLGPQHDAWAALLEASATEPLRTAIEILGGLEAALNAGLTTPMEVSRAARELLLDQVGALDRRQLAAAQRLGVLKEVARRSPANWERMAARALAGEDPSRLARELAPSLGELLKAARLLRGSPATSGPAGKSLEREITSRLPGGTLSDLLDAASALGHLPEASTDVLGQLIKDSVARDLEEGFRAASLLDQFFGTPDLRNQILEEANRQGATLSVDDLVRHHRRSLAWRRALERTVQEKLLGRGTTSAGAGEPSFQDLLEAARNLGDWAASASDAVCQRALEFHAWKVLDQAVGAACNPGQLEVLVAEAEDLAPAGGGPDNGRPHLPESFKNSVAAAGRQMGMSEVDVAALISPDVELLKTMIREAGSEDVTFERFKSVASRVPASPNLVADLTSEVLDRASSHPGTGPQLKPPLLDFLGHLASKDLGTAMDVATQAMGEAGGNLVVDAFSGPGAGSGENLLLQWYLHRDSVPPNVRDRVKALAREVLVDLGLKFASAFIGSETSGALCEERVVSFTPGDDFFDVDLDQTLEHLVSSGKDPKHVRYDDFMVHEKGEGLRTIAVELDVSGSMEGEKLAYCAISAVMVLYAFSPDEVAVCLFESNTHVLKEVDDDAVDLDSAADELLEVRAMGGTMMSKAMEWARRTFEKKARSKARVNVLLTDAEVFDLEDCKGELEKMRNLDVAFVIVVPRVDFNGALAKEMSKLVGGRILAIEDWRQFPRKVSEVLSERW
ncbi:MAG: hypothetical protein Kow0069_24670 [Promethearchaeota archaeon]